MAVKRYSMVSTTDGGVVSHIDHDVHESADWPMQWCKAANVEALEQEVERLVAALTAVKSDLLRRGEKDSQGVVAVNLSSSVWLQLCDALAHKEDQ